MFTGIIEAVGTVKAIEKRGTSGTIAVASTLDLTGTNIGESISTNGACLTVTKVSGDVFTADVSGETLNVTTLGILRSGDKVNLEQALTLSSRIGGHMVSGHVDTVGTVESLVQMANGVTIGVSVGSEHLKQIVRKGSVAISGISLTVADLSSTGFTVAVIPQTLKETTLASFGVGSRVNVETDMMAKYVEKYLGGTKGGLTVEYLKEQGFIK